MKLTAILLLATFLTVSAGSNAQKITLNEVNAPLQKLFKEIWKQSGFQFVYTDKTLEGAKPVTINVKDEPLENVLKLCFAQQPFDFTIADGAIVIKQKLSVISNDSEKSPAVVTIDVKGRLVNENNEPVPGASIKVKGTTLGTTTNANGEFTLTGVDENATLIFSGTNIETFEKKIGSSGDLGTITARIKIAALNEVIINKGYYKTNRITEVGNVSTVTAAEIEKQPVSNPLLALQGRVPGMQITQANGLPGSGVVVRIRGQNSIDNGNDPLYVVDGVPYLSQMLPGLFSGITGSSGAFGGNSAASSGSPLSYINPGDIESIDVLKDADATAIYGTRGANGVVLITTKKGKQGGVRVDINVQNGWGSVTHFVPWLNTRQYLDMRYEALKNDGVTVGAGVGGDVDLKVWDTTRYTDWNKELIGGTARFSNIQLSLSGGSSNVQYRIGYNYNKQTTVFPGSFGDPKGSLSFNISSSSNNKKLQIQFAGNYQVDKNELPDYDLSQFVNLAPIAPALHNSDGSLNWAPDPNNGNPTWDNPLARLNSRYKRRVNNLITNASLSYKLTSALEAKVSTGYTNILSNETRTNPSSLYFPGFTIERWTRFSGTQNDSWIVEPQLTYRTKIAGGELSALIGSTIQQNDSKGQTIWARGFSSDIVMEDSKAASSVQIESSLNAIYKYNAVFGRLNYNFGDKYLANLTARRDGTSRFGPGKQFSNFGAAGLGWVFSKEKFIEKAFPFLSFGKVRASYGTTGSDQIGDYRFYNLYQYVNYAVPYQGSLSLILNGLFNTDLAWEETKKFEVGIDLGFAKDRIFFSLSYFRNRSSNQLTSYQVPLNTGAPSVPANLDATVQNTGWELVLNTRNIETKAFRWTSSINLSIPRNKLVSLGPNAFFIDKRLVGQSLSTRFVYRYAGVNATNGQYEFYDGKGGLTFRPDTAYDRSTNVSYAQTPLNTATTFFGGFQNNIEWKGFQLNFLFQFEKRLGESNHRGRYPGSFYTFNQPITVLDRWQKLGDNALVQRFNQNFSIYNSVGYLNSSDGVWMDASYVRLKNVSLSWRLPKALMQKLHLFEARIYTQAQNLFTISSYKGFDPETRSLTSLPPLRVWTFGFQLTL